MLVLGRTVNLKILMVRKFCLVRKNSNSKESNGGKILKSVLGRTAILKILMVRKFRQVSFRKNSNSKDTNGEKILSIQF